MRNAKEEILVHIKCRKVKLVKIVLCNGYDEEDRIKIEGDLDSALPKLDLAYDSGYGGQNLFGYIWYEDGTWSERGEYDGSEWWEYRSLPDLNCNINA